MSCFFRLFCSSFWSTLLLGAALLLSIRFSRDRGDVGTRLRHLHDFAASEVNRLIQEQSGAVAVLSLVGTLLGVQIRLGQPDGMMAAAKLTFALLHKCPGLARSELARG